jgi:hypothetical protein
MSTKDITNIYEQALKELEEIVARQKRPDVIDDEHDHLEADRILCVILRSQGHNKIVDTYESISKFY